MIWKWSRRSGHELKTSCISKDTQWTPTGKRKIFGIDTLQGRFWDDFNDWCVVFLRSGKTACMLVLSENFHVHACIKIFKTRQQKENNQQNKETNSPLHQSFLGVPLDVLNQGPAPIASKTFWRKTVLANVVPGRKKKRRRCIVTANILTTTSYQRVWHIETSSTVLLNFSWCKTRKRVPTVLSDRILFFTIDLIAPGCFRRAMKVIRTADALRNAYSESKKRIQPDKWF